MKSPRAALLLSLLAVGCADAHAQPRRDAGAARRWIVPSTPVRGLGLLRGAEGIPPDFFLRNVSDGSNIREMMSQGTAISAAAPVPTPTGDTNVGTIGLPASEGRFDVLERVEGVPLGDARSWLAVAGGWALRCLERVRHATPFDSAVRFTVARDGSVAGVAADDAPPAALTCLVEGFGHARFRPVARPVELVARYRYTVRWSPTRRTDPRPSARPRLPSPASPPEGSTR